MNDIKIYLNNSKYIIWDLADWFAEINTWFINRLYKKIHKREFEYIKTTITDYYSKLSVYQGLLSPVVVVYKVLEEHFGFNSCFRLKIHSIDVDTQNKSSINVTIKLFRPGLLIGHHGKDIDAIQNKLTEIFAKTTKINIVEVKKDINEPMRY